MTTTSDNNVEFTQDELNIVREYNRLKRLERESKLTPEKIELLKSKRSEYNRRHNLEVKSDPKKLEQHKSYQKSYRARRTLQIKSDLAELAVLRSKMMEVGE